MIPLAPAGSRLHSPTWSSQPLAGLQVDELHAGEVGWLSASIRAVADARVGDTITLKGKQGAQHALPGAFWVRCMQGCTQALLLLLLLLLHDP